MRFGVVLLSLVLCGSAAAESKDRPLIQKQHCLLQVDGKTYMAGRCQYWVSKEGDVMITGRSKLYPRLGPFKQGIVVWADPDVEAAWNGPFVERHAHDSLGKLIVFKLQRELGSRSRRLAPSRRCRRRRGRSRADRNVWRRDGNP